MISISCKNSISLDGCNTHINNFLPLNTYTFLGISPYDKVNVPITM